MGNGCSGEETAASVPNRDSRVTGSGPAHQVGGASTTLSPSEAAAAAALARRGDDALEQRRRKDELVGRIRERLIARGESVPVGLASMDLPALERLYTQYARQ